MNPASITAMLPLCRLSFALAAPHRLAVRDAVAAASLALAAGDAWRIDEAILQSIPYSGFPAAVEAFALLQTERGPAGERTIEQEPRAGAASGDEMFTGIYGAASDRVREHLRRGHPQLEMWIRGFAYGTVMARGLLAPVELEILAVSSLIGQARYAPLHSHLRGALRFGCAPEALAALFDGLADVADPDAIATARRLCERA